MFFNASLDALFGRPDGTNILSKRSLNKLRHLIVSLIEIVHIIDQGSALGESFRM